MRWLMTALSLALMSEVKAEEAAPRLATPFAEEAYWAPAVAGREPGSLHGLINFNLTSQYITNNGLVMENQGLIGQPLLMLSTPLYADKTTWLSEATLTVGGWGSWHSHAGGKIPAHWREADVFGGLTFTVARDWKLSAFYSAYVSPNASFNTAWELALTLSYDDSRWLGKFALHPFLEFRRQTEGAITVAFRPDLADESYCFKFGINPSHQFSGFKLELPAFVTWVPNGFYQQSVIETRHITYYGYDYKRFRYYPIDYAYQVQDGKRASSGVGYFSTALKATIPIPWLSNERTATSVYGAVQYYRLVNAGLLDGNQYLGASGRRERDLVQFHVGVNVTF